LDNKSRIYIYIYVSKVRINEDIERRDSDLEFSDTVEPKDTFRVMTVAMRKMSDTMSAMKQMFDTVAQSISSLVVGVVQRKTDETRENSPEPTPVLASTSNIQKRKNRTRKHTTARNGSPVQYTKSPAASCSLGRSSDRRSLPDQSYRSATASKLLIHTLHFSFPVKGGSLLLLFGLTCVEASACSKSESEEMFESDMSVDTQGVRLSVRLTLDFVYDQLSSTITKSYKKLTRELGDRFGEVDTTRIYISKFNNRRQMFNGSIQEFAPI
jgi:hypothetical protein